MIGLNKSYPTENELRDRIVRQLSRRGVTASVALIWHGYLTGLLEWGLIEVDIFDRLSDLLPKVGQRELIELSLDEPISTEMSMEIGQPFPVRTRRKIRTYRRRQISLRKPNKLK